jgi:ATP-binding cassette subfamily C protein
MAAFFLDDARRAWQVDGGAVDVFLAARAGGARHHVYRIEAGQPLLELDAARFDSAWGLLAVPTPGAVLREAAEPQAASIEAWIAATARGMRLQPPPQAARLLEAGVPVELAAGNVFSPSERLLFVRLESGEAALLGDPQARIGTAPMPLRGEVWGQALSPCRLIALDAASAAVRPDFHQGLHAWHLAVAQLALARAVAARDGEAARMKRQAEIAGSFMDSALALLSGLMRGGAEQAPGTPSADPLLAACEAIGARNGIRFVTPPRAVVKTRAVEALADAAGVRYRQVALRGQWWRAEHGDLLGFVEEGHRPVALLKSGRGYEMRDASSGEARALDEAAAQTLAPFAYEFFRTLPAKKLGIMDLVRFGSFGMTRDVLRVVLLGFAVGAVGLLTPVASGFLFDTLIPTSDRTQALQLTGALLAAALGAAMFAFARSLATLRVETRMDYALQAALWDRVLNLPASFFRGYAAGDLAVRIHGINAIRQALSGTTVGTILSSVFALLNVGLMFYYSTPLALAGLGLVAAAVVLTLGCGWVELRYQRHMAEAGGRLSGLVLEYMHGIAKLRVTATEPRAFANWASEFGALKLQAYRAGRVHNVTDVFYAVFASVSDMLIFAVVALYVLKQQSGSGLSIGQFIAFNAAFGQVLGAVVGLAATALGLLGLVPLWERAKPVIETLPESDTGKAHPGELEGAIEVAGVCHRYGADAPLVLDRVSFSVRPGGFIALVGPSGSGKSTLLRCLLGLERLSAGSIFFDNRNQSDLDMRAVRRQIGVVLQHGQLLTGDIYTNIVGTTEYTLEEAWGAARRCGMEEDINAMPMGMYTLVSEGGSTLSGGQRQRIMIARALVARPRVVFLDEATSALDNRTQAIVAQSLAELRATRIVIAHRLSTVMRADRILVLDKGRIVQTGSYPSLMAEPGLFRELAARQLA